MKHIIKPRRFGKTDAIIKECSEQGGYIVCPDIRQVQAIVDCAIERNITIPFPLTWQEFIHGRYHAMGIKKFHIDNLDQCIANSSAVPIATISMTLPEDKETKGG